MILFSQLTGQCKELSLIECFSSILTAGTVFFLTGTILIVLVYFYQLSKEGIFLFWGVVKKQELGFLGGLKKNAIILSSVLLLLPLPDLPQYLYPPLSFR